MPDPIINSSISALQESNRNTSGADKDRKKLADDFDQFLLLLTTQLKNQDPTDPLDTNDFTSQLVQFASVEQQIAANTNLETLVGLAGKSDVDNSLGYIGRAIEAEGNAGLLSNGQGTFVYSLPQTAGEVKVTITDPLGRAVFSGDGSTLSGHNVVTWDGVNSFTGEQMPDGDYRIVVAAKGTDGSDIAAKTFTTGRVSAAEIDGEGGTVLVLGNIKVPTVDVVAVREIPSTI